MAEVNNSISITHGEVVQHFEELGKDKVVEMLLELTSNVDVLVNNVSSLIDEDKLLAAGADVCFAACFVAYGEPMVTVIHGAKGGASIAVRTLIDAYKQQYVSEEDIQRFDKLYYKLKKAADVIKDDSED